MGSKKEAVILFADIIGCSQISNALTIQVYADFLKQFHSACRDSFDIIQKIPELTLKEPSECEFYVKGDECCVFLHKTENNMKEIEWAIRFALALQLNWLVSQHNIENARKCILPVGVGIGIHQGLVYYDKFQGDKESSEGYCINLTKRIEGTSREGQTSKIYISEQVYSKLENVMRLKARFTKPIILEKQLKGINTAIQVRELEEADRNLFKTPAREISKKDIDQLKFCAIALPNTKWLKLLIQFISVDDDVILGYLKDIRRNIIDNLGINHWLNDAEYQMNQKNYPQARKYIEEALNISSKGENFDVDTSAITRTTTLFSRWYFEQGSFQESIDWARVAIKRDRFYLPAYYYLIESLYKTKQYKECRYLTAEIKGLNVSYVLPNGISKGYFWFKDAEMLCELHNKEYKNDVIISLKKAIELDNKLLGHIEQNKHLTKGLAADELLELKN